ncbi:unnamed protein product [Spirodela intermedia]|uniref:Phytocyanin domain-containing protein n=1 Tax=Spirodela intermedia TaxID=51605 RepID=A0A7I8K605_SPIIN|nr:unnamed protein product [Spirodela intermedia]
MERRSLPFSCMFLALACLVLLQSVHGAEGYRNYTVGDSLGWYDKLKEPKVDYKKWVAGKNFSLGDFLIFNTDKNHSVVQTYNATTYQRCDYKNAEDDTVLWSTGPPSFDGVPVSIAVALVAEGMNYFFSGLYAGAQCRHGQRFKINVTHGHGLPESLRNPPPAAEAPPPDDGGVPETTVPYDFSHPKPMQEGMASGGRRRHSAVDLAGLLAAVFLLVYMGGKP